MLHFNPEFSVCLSVCLSLWYHNINSVRCFISSSTPSSLSLSLSLFFFFSGIILTLPDASFQPRVLSFFIFFFFLWYNIYNINSVRCFISTPSSLSLSLWYHNINSVRRFMTPEFSLCLSSSVGIIILTLSDASFEPRIEQFTRHTARSHKRRQTHSLTPGP